MAQVVEHLGTKTLKGSRPLWVIHPDQHVYFYFIVCMNTKECFPSICHLLEILKGIIKKRPLCHLLWGGNQHASGACRALAGAPGPVKLQTSADAVALLKYVCWRRKETVRASPAAC
jgi:hypothetical protein